MKIKKTITAILLTLGCTSAYAQSQLVTDTFDSKILNQKFNIEVYLPNGYEESQDKYPVIYMLHGAGGDESNWRVRGSIQYAADALINRQNIRPSIIVMPTLGPHSWWANGNAENAETAFIEDLIPYIEQNYKASDQRKDRSIAGLSMGGYGALNLSL